MKLQQLFYTLGIICFIVYLVSVAPYFFQGVAILALFVGGAVVLFKIFRKFQIFRFIGSCLVSLFLGLLLSSFFGLLAAGAGAAFTAVYTLFSPGKYTVFEVSAMLFLIVAGFSLIGMIQDYKFKETYQKSKQAQ